MKQSSVNNSTILGSTKSLMMQLANSVDHPSSLSVAAGYDAASDHTTNKQYQ